MNEYDLRLESIAKDQQTVTDCIDTLESIQPRIDLSLDTFTIRDIIWKLREIRDEFQATELFLKIRRK